MAEWRNHEDFFRDINEMSEFCDDDDDLAIEVNQNTFLDESSTESATAEAGLSNDVFSVTRPAQSDRIVMDRVAAEVADGLRIAGCVWEAEGAFLKSIKQHNKEDDSSSSSFSSASYYTAESSLDHSPQNSTKKNRPIQSKSRPFKPKQSKFRPLDTAENPLSMDNFPKLK